MKLFRTFIISSFLLAACSPNVPEMHIQPVYKKIAVVSDGIDSKVDILFVIDDSGSMQSHQNNLAKNIDLFVKSFTANKFLDFHIGVISTGMESYNNHCCGVLVGSPAYFERTTPNLNQVLASRMMLGTSGSAEEMGFEPVYAALSEPNFSQANKGFFRKNAKLAVIFITDAEEQSSRLDARSLLDFLVAQKGAADRVFGYGVIVPSHSTIYCPRDEPDYPPLRYEEFLGMVSNHGNNIMNLCAADFGQQLADMGKDLVRRVAGAFYLSQLPIPNSITVQFGTQEILPNPENPKKGWYFDADMNAVILGEDIEWTEQPLGTKLKINYSAI